MRVPVRIQVEMSWMRLLLGVPLLGALAMAQLPATGLATDVAQTSLGELRITPLDGPSFLLAWAGRHIYVDPLKAADFQGAWPKADLIVLTGAGQLNRHLRKRTTQIVAPGTVERGHTRAFTLNGSGKPVKITVEAVPTTSPPSEQGYVLKLGNTGIYISGPTPCEAGQLISRKLQIAFVALTTVPPITPQAAAICVDDIAPEWAYPYLQEDDSAQQFTAALKSGSHIKVQSRDWHPKPR